MLIVEGEMIHHVGYRPFLLVEALKRKKITNFEAENFKEDGKQKVIINMVGEEQKILEFVKFIKNNFPDYAKNCKVIEEKESCLSEVMHINDFRDILGVEQQNNIVQGGLQISDKIDNLGIGLGDKIDNLGIGLGDKIDTLRNETNNNFNELDIKYKLISEGMFAIANELKETNKIFEKRIEKTEKNIEELLKILVEKK